MSRTEPGQEALAIGSWEAGGTGTIPATLFDQGFLSRG